MGSGDGELEHHKPQQRITLAKIRKMVPSRETPRRIYDKSDASTEFAARSANSFACAITRTGVLSNM